MTAKDFNNTNVLITGGLGFIGSNLAMHLLELGAKVTIIDSMIPEYGGNLFNIESIKKLVTVNYSDIRDQHSLVYLVKGKDYIFNLAGQTSHMDSMSDPFTDLDINASSQLKLLEACKKHNPNVRIVFASTRQLYGKPQYLPVDEKHPIVPVDVNGINKNAGEQYHILYNNVYNIPCTCLRLTNTFGPRMRIKDARQTFLGVWIRNTLQNAPFEVWGGHQLRDYNYVDDVVSALVLAVTKEQCIGKTYNLGHSEVLSLIDTAKIFKVLMPETSYKIIAYPEERKKIDIGDYYSDFSLFKKHTNWHPKHNFREALKLTLEYYKGHINAYL